MSFYDFCGVYTPYQPAHPLLPHTSQSSVVQLKPPVIVTKTPLKPPTPPKKNPKILPLPPYPHLCAMVFGLRPWSAYSVPLPPLPTLTNTTSLEPSSEVEEKAAVATEVIIAPMFSGCFVVGLLGIFGCRGLWGETAAPGILGILGAGQVLGVLGALGVQRALGCQWYWGHWRSRWYRGC